MRLFVSIAPPPAAVDHLRGFLADRWAVHADDRLRWTLPEQWHLTLAFLGAVDEVRVPELDRRLTRAAARSRPLRLAVEGAGAFGSRRRARVLWAGIGGEPGDLAELRALAGSVAAGAERAGVPVADQRFRPHLTLARLREPLDLRDLVERIAPYAGPGWTARRLLLVRSHLGQGEGRRSRYETVAARPLGRAGSGAPGGE